MRTKTLPIGSNPLGNQRGFTYLSMLVVVVVIGILAEVGVLMQSTQSQRAKEQELLFRGIAYMRAIQSYYESGKTVKTLPRKLQDLLSDPRYLHRKHIRKLYSNPLGGDWTLLRDDNGAIKGIAPASEDVPFKKDHFPQDLKEFASAATYADWRFEFNPTVKNPKINTVQQQKSPN